MACWSEKLSYNTELILKTNHPATRTVYTLIRYPWDDPKNPVPSDLSDPRWTPWIGCKGGDIDSGIIAGMAAYRAFRGQAGPKMFQGPAGVRDFKIAVLLFDPVTHATEAEAINTAHSTEFCFSPSEPAYESQA